MATASRSTLKPIASCTESVDIYKDDETFFIFSIPTDHDGRFPCSDFGQEGNKLLGQAGLMKYLVQKLHK